MAEDSPVWKMDYECIGVLSQLYRGHRVERPAFYLERSGRDDKIEPFDVVSEVEEGNPAGPTARQWHVASPVGRSATHFRKTPNTREFRVMRSKRVSKALKIAVEWTPGARTIAWQELWRRILIDAFRAMPKNSDPEGRDGDK